MSDGPKDKQPSTGNGELPCYKVEVRTASRLPPREIGGMIVDSIWRTLQPTRSSFGVPVLLGHAEAERQGYLSYDAAMALAFWFLASTESFSLVEARIVRFLYKYNYVVTREHEAAPLLRECEMLRAEREAVDKATCS